MKRICLLPFALCFLLFACQSSKDLYGLWRVHYIQTKEQLITGKMMGNLQYEFTKEGKRVQTLDTIPKPPPDSITFKLGKKEISYPENPKLPTVKILKLTKDSLVLKSEKAEWHLYKK